VHPSDTEAPPRPGSRTGKIVGAIPARYDSKRLPGKVLLPIAGRPMIEHVYRRAARAKGLTRLVVLTDDVRIAEVVARFGGECEMTPAECASGTDRIAWAAREWDAAAVVNVQGDEPLIDPTAITTLAEHLAEHPNEPIATLAAEAEPGDAENPNVVKVVTDLAGFALYFTRAPVPYRRETGGPPTLRHIGIYGYQRAALLELASKPPSPLERAEGLEQLRALENGVRIRVLRAAGAWWGVDTMADLERTETYLRGQVDASETD
jgi:3-deoxy-manno-octulosonate cytidylyltransferase (CMP-KDO synthetase)